MFTYDVVSESIRNPHELAAELTRRSEQGWEVVQVVYDGATWFHAIIRHEGRVGVAPYPGASAPKDLGVDTAVATTAPGAAEAVRDQPLAATVGAMVEAAEARVGSSSASAPTSVTEPAAAPGSQTSSPAASATDSAVPDVPANWYKDPSGRFELRYWNGTAWTEHVATGGRQSVDPPKA